MKKSVNYDSMFQNCIFRYRKIKDNSFEDLNCNRLYFSTPIKDFNDPYDNLIFANSTEIVSEIINNIVNEMDNYLEKEKDTNPVEAFVFSQKWNDSKQRSKILNEHKNRIYNTIDTIKKAIRNNTKIICFSEVYDSMLMWSHYADYHRGYTLIYDKNDLVNASRYGLDDSILKNHTRLEKVKYVSEQIDLTENIKDYARYEVFETMGDVEKINGKVPQLKLEEAIIEKSKEWEYEKEWRLIPRLVHIEEPSPLGYIECVPRGIILGAKCTDENRDQIIKIGKKNHIHIYQMSLDEKNPTFKLNIGEGENARIC